MTERMNMLRVEAPVARGQEKLPFDPERDITEEDWREITAEQKRLRPHLPDEAAKLGAYMYGLDDRRLSVGARRWTVAHLRKEFAEECPGNDWEEILSLGEALSILKPGDARRIIPDSSWQWLTERVKGLNHIRGERYSFVVHAAQLLLIDPRSRLWEEEGSWTAAEQEAQKERNSIQPRSVITMLHLLFAMKVLGPGKAVEATEEEWADMHRNLESRRVHTKWVEFANEAFQMKALAANEVRVGEKGLEIRMHKDTSDEQVPPMPEATSLPQ